VCLQLHVVLTKRQTIAAWEPSKKQWSFGNRGAVNTKTFHPDSVKSSAELFVADSQLTAGSHTPSAVALGDFFLLYNYNDMVVSLWLQSHEKR